MALKAMLAAALATAIAVGFMLPTTHPKAAQPQPHS
jgi:hypothetical protein